MVDYKLFQTAWLNYNVAMKSVYVLLILLNISIALCMSRKVGNSKNVIFKAVKPEFLKGEEVCFYLENKTNEEILMPSSSPWVILRGEEVIHSPIALQVITVLKPSEKKEWCWNQRDTEGKEVASGDYTVRITFFDGKGKQHSLSTLIKIKEMH